LSIEPHPTQSGFTHFTDALPISFPFPLLVANASHLIQKRYALLIEVPPYSDKASVLFEKRSTLLIEVQPYSEKSVSPFSLRCCHFSMRHTFFVQKRSTSFKDAYPFFQKGIPFQGKYE